MNPAAHLHAPGGSSGFAGSGFAGSGFEGNTALAQDSYHNVANLQQLKTLDENASLDAVSRQFESLLRTDG